MIAQSNALTLSIFLGLTAALANVLGGLVMTHREWDRRWLNVFVALGSGFMLATALAEMLPESMALDPRLTPVLAVAGYALVHTLEHAFVHHFHFGEETHHEEFLHPAKTLKVLLALVVHTFFDGIAIASGFLISRALGWIIFTAVVLHKLPEGLTVASVMLAGGSSRMRALGAAALLGAATLAGVLTMGLVHGWVRYGLPLSAGVTLYVAATDLVPEANKTRGGMSLVVLLGMALMLVLKSLLPG